MRHEVSLHAQSSCCDAVHAGRSMCPTGICWAILWPEAGDCIRSWAIRLCSAPHTALQCWHVMGSSCCCGGRKWMTEVLQPLNERVAEIVTKFCRPAGGTAAMEPLLLQEVDGARVGLAASSSSACAAALCQPADPSGCQRQLEPWCRLLAMLLAAAGGSTCQRTASSSSGGLLRPLHNRQFGPPYDVVGISPAGSS